MRWWLALGGAVAVLVTSSRPVSPAEQHPGRYWFHHLHLNDARPPFLLEYYERLFNPTTTRRTTLGESAGLQSGSMLLLISRGQARAEPTALWHFGWGSVSLGETYLAHARREVAWEPPLPASRLHLHLRSTSPRAAAAWYRDLLEARVTVVPASSAVDEALPPPEHRMPEALVWFGEMGLTIYRTNPPLVSTRGQTADHFAIGCADLDAAVADLRRRGVPVEMASGPNAAPRSAMIEGPDRIAIELVEVR